MYYYKLNITWASEQYLTSSSCELQDATDFVEYVDLSDKSDFSTYDRINATDTTISIERDENTENKAYFYVRPKLKNHSALRLFYLNIHYGTSSQRSGYVTMKTGTSNTDWIYYPTDAIIISSISGIASTDKENPSVVDVIFGGANIVYNIAIYPSGPGYTTNSTYPMFCPNTQNDTILNWLFTDEYYFSGGSSDTKKYGWTLQCLSNVFHTPEGMISRTITFNPSGGSVTPTSKEYPCAYQYEGWSTTINNWSNPIGIVSKLPIPTNGNKVFNGWYYSYTSGSSTYERKITDDTSCGVFYENDLSEIYAKWGNDRETQIVNFYTQGICKWTQKTIIEGEAFGELPKSYMYGCVFKGWYTEPSGGDKITESTIVVGSSDLCVYAQWDISELFYGVWDTTSFPNIESSVILTGVWNPIQLNADEYYRYEWESGETTKTVMSKYVTINFYCRSIKIGTTTYNTGWKRLSVVNQNGKYNSTNSYIYSFDSLLTSSRGSTISSYYISNTYSHYMYHMRSVTSYNAEENKNGVAITRFPPTPVVIGASGVHFLGWSTKEDDASCIISTGTVIETTINTITLYAIFETDTTASKYVAFDGGTPSTIYFNDGDTVEIPMEHPTRTDVHPTRGKYIFAGWGNKLVAESTTEYAAEYLPGYTYTFEDSTTLYPVWSAAIVQNLTDTPNDDYGVDQGIEIIDNSSYFYPEISGTLPGDSFLIPSCTPYMYCVSIKNKFGYYQILWDETAIELMRAQIGLIPGKVLVRGIRSLEGQILENHITIAEQSNKFNQFIATNSHGEYVANAYSVISIGLDVDHLDEDGFEFYGWFSNTSQIGWGYGDMYVENGILSTTPIITIANDHNAWRPLTGTILCPLIRYKHILCMFDPQGGTVEPEYMEYAINGTFHSLPTPIYGAIEFKGWYTEPSGGTKVQNGDSISPRTEDFILYAQWGGTLSEMRVYFIANGGICPTEYKIIEKGKPYGELPVATRDGYTFLGWYSSYVETVATTSETVVTRSENHYLYAHWAGAVFTITLDPNGGTVSPNTISVENGYCYGTLPTPQYSGYKFSGWYTQQSSGVAVKSEDKPLGDGTLYAHWEKSSSVDWGFVRRGIEFITNGGTISTEYGEYKYVVGTIKQLPTSEQITRQGYVFVGWYKTADFSGDVILHTEVTDNTRLTFYAKWE